MSKPNLVQLKRGLCFKEGHEMVFDAVVIVLIGGRGKGAFYSLQPFPEIRNHFAPGLSVRLDAKDALFNVALHTRKEFFRQVPARQLEPLY